MPQDLQPPETWIFRRDAIDVIPLVVKVLGVPTTDYTIQVQPEGVDSDLAGTWSGPDSFPPDTGYRVNGPVLGGGSPGKWFLYVKINDNPQIPVRLAVIIRLT